MNSSEETLQTVQKILGPYIRPREEVAHIRRVLALHLSSCLKDGSATAPLALAESSDVQPSSSSRGLQRDYLEALSANTKASKEYRAVCQKINQPQEERPVNAGPTHDRLQDHLATISLQRKQDKLQAVGKHLDLLRQKPAASEHSKPLPDVPAEVFSAVTLDKTTASTHLKGLVDQLEKHMFRTKLLLRREEQLLEQARARFSSTNETVSESTKFEALNTTRTELINWIETELGKASGDDGHSGDGNGNGSSHGKAHRSLAEKSRFIDEQLVSIREKYARYLEARKGLLQLVSQQPTPIIKPPTVVDNESLQITSAPVPPAPFTHLLSPYVEQLFAVSHEQKGLIAQKSHLNNAIARQLKDNCQVLDHLAEESQLIPGHPMPGGAAGRNKPMAFGEAMAAASSSSGNMSSSTSRARPWVFAADSAKISTLETVAEKIEEGQIALEGSMRTIGEIEMLLGGYQSTAKNIENEEEVAGDDDIWLVEGQSARRKSIGSRKHISRKEDDDKNPCGDVWDMLDGNLGLLRSETDLP
ncbi:hypothetical protein B0T17DRAFT_588544 [Bombardia bombarda]|uniref:Uncharacterized protein n=1 Tax=Bombardia bombarda TaxID=252184 RepID=A0AA39X7Z9_9PEZI|nr:hypothetical protein B0T17DRAFT_588544 [Bombardia bombarda]